MLLNNLFNSKKKFEQILNKFFFLLSATYFLIGL